MTKVDATQAQNKLTTDYNQLETLEDVRDAEMIRRAMEEHEEFVTLEEVIANYNELHGTDFTIESILNDNNDDEVDQNL